MASTSSSSSTSSSLLPRSRPLSPMSGLTAAEAASRRALLSFRVVELEGATHKSLADRLEALAQMLWDDTRRERPALNLGDRVGKVSTTTRMRCSVLRVAAPARTRTVSRWGTHVLTHCVSRCLLIRCHWPRFRF